MPDRGDPPPAAAAPPLPHVKIAESLDARMNGLLERAMEQSATSSRQELFHKILDQIVVRLNLETPLRGG